MINNVYRVIRTAMVKCAHFNKIKIKGVLNICHDTKIKIVNNGEILLGKNATTFNNVHLSAPGGKLEIGDNVFFNRNCIVICREAITIGNGCIFGPNVCVYDHDHQFDDTGIKEGYKTTPIIVEDNCWIGANAIILRGTHIGKGSIIGAGTVIRGDIPSNSIATNDRKLIVKPIESGTKQE